MKIVRKDYPKIRAVEKSGNTYFVVDLRRKHYQGPKFKWFKEKSAALTYAADVAEKVNKNGVESISKIGEDPRIKSWTEQFAIYNKTLEEGITAALTVFEKERQVKDSRLISELLADWKNDKINNPLKPLRQRSAQTIRYMADTFAKDFAGLRIKEVNPERVEEYFKKLDGSNQTKANMRNYLGQFFNWCLRKSLHFENPVKNVEITVQRKAPEFFTVEQCKTIMEVAEAGEMSAYFALGLFAGVRPKEIERMTWKDVNLDTQEIHLSSEMTKTKKARLFKMSENLVSWLRVLPKDKPLINTGHKKAKDAILKALDQKKIVWVQDGLRHTFATFHYAKHKSLDLLRHDMGNSPEVIERFYRGAISAGEVNKFWGILPASEELKKKKQASKDYLDTMEMLRH